MLSSTKSNKDMEEELKDFLNGEVQEDVDG